MDVIWNRRQTYSLELNESSNGFTRTSVRSCGIHLRVVHRKCSKYHYLSSNDEFNITATSPRRQWVQKIQTYRDHERLSDVNQATCIQYRPMRIHSINQPIQLYHLRSKRNNFNIGSKITIVINPNTIVVNFRFVIVILCCYPRWSFASNLWYCSTIYWALSGSQDV